MVRLQTAESDTERRQTMQENRFECPSCGSLHTNTHIVATTNRMVKFLCVSCDHEFPVDNAVVGLPLPAASIRALRSLNAKRSKPRKDSE